MLRAILGIVAGFVITGIVTENDGLKRLKDTTVETASKLKSATLKAAAAARQELSSKASK